jgi:hypothetical protein
MLSRRCCIRTALRSSATALLLTATLAAPAMAQDRDSQRDDAFTWSGTIPSGRRIMIKNINGAIEVERSTSGGVEVRAEKRWRRGDPDDVRIEARQAGAGNGDPSTARNWASSSIHAPAPSVHRPSTHVAR